MNKESQEIEAHISGPTTIQSYDIIKYYIPNGTGQWFIPAAAPVTLLSFTDNEIKMKVNKVDTSTTFDLKHGEQVLTITVNPFK